MCDNKALGFALSCFSKIYAIRQTGGGNDEFIAFSEMIVYLLSKYVEDTDYAQVFALDGDELVGWNRGKAEGWDVFVDIVCGFIINGYGKDAKIGVDAQCSMNVFSDRRGVCVEDDGLTNGHKHARFSNIPTFVKAFHYEILGITAIDDQVIGCIIGDIHLTSMRRAAMKIEMQIVGSDNDLLVVKWILCV